MKPLLALVLAGATLGGGAYWYLSSGQESNAPTIRVDVKEGNGKVTVSWTRVKTSGGAAVTGYDVMAEPYGPDRVPPPRLVTPPAERVPAANSKPITISGLLEDCHQRYQVVVTPETNSGSDPPVTSRSFRPSGIVNPGRPPYVVILLDGIGESKPGFTLDPYHPTMNAAYPSYCPESINHTGQYVNGPYSDFKKAPRGPAEFFAKWNFFDPSDTANGNDPRKNSNSTPRDLSHPDGQTPGPETHTFMLDAIAATGAVILPYSYTSAVLKAGRGSDPTFNFQAYSSCNSTPPFVVNGSHLPGCNPSGPVPQRQFTLDHDVQQLDLEVLTIRKIWKSVPIVIVGHSQGGLIAFDAWSHQTSSGLMLPPVEHLFSLDSPINGACLWIGTACLRNEGYPEFSSLAARVSDDQAYIARDNSLHNPFRLIGTWGDEIRVNGPPILGYFPAYGTGNETLQHQLLVESASCVSASNDSGCPDPPDHISAWSPSSPATNECKISNRGWVNEDAHFIVKFCPGNVNYFNTVLGLSLDQAGPRSPCSSDTFLDVVRTSYSSSYRHSSVGVGQPTCVGGYAEEDFVPYAGGQQAPFFFREVSPGKWNLIEGGDTGEFPAACSTIPPAIMAKLGFGCPTPQTQSCSIPGGAEGGANLPFTTTGLSCADGTRLVRAVTAAIPNYGTAGTLHQVQGFVCQIAPPAGYPPGSHVSPGWRVTCTKGAETLDFELPG